MRFELLLSHFLSDASVVVPRAPAWSRSAPPEDQELALSTQPSRASPPSRWDVGDERAIFSFVSRT